MRCNLWYYCSNKYGGVVGLIINSNDDSLKFDGHKYIIKDNKCRYKDIMPTLYLIVGGIFKMNFSHIYIYIYLIC